MRQHSETSDFPSRENVETAAPWHNWAGNIEAVPAYTITAREESDVVAAVKYAAENGLKARVVGTGHSWTGLGETDGVLIDVRNLRSFRVSDRDAKRVVVGAGISIFDACEALWEEGFSLKNQGDIDVQTIAGAASTGTHGSGVTLQNIAASIRRIRLVDGTGSIREITEDDPSSSTRLASRWAPSACSSRSSSRSPTATTSRRKSPSPPGTSWSLTGTTTSRTTCTPPCSGSPASTPPPCTTSRFPSGTWSTSRTDGGSTRSTAPPARPIAYHRVDRNYLIYHGTFTGPYFELEYFVPAERSLEAMRRIRDIYLDDFPDESFPVQPRWIKRDDAYLSPCYGRDSVGISISGNASTDYLTFLRAVHDLFTEFDARPHWGKFHFFTRDDARKVFPKFDEFTRVRAELDPQGVFLNKQTGELFG